ncbi:MAG: succinate--CoA ligase subunit beta [Candidatus Izemoplasmataceae bacterium]
MKLYEYQAKDLFESYGIPVPRRVLTEDMDALPAALKTIGFPCVLKSQVLEGGRGKRGLIPFVKNEDEALKEAKRLFTEENIQRVMVEEAVHIEEEIYLSVTVDAEAGTALVMASREGGVEIETLASEAPEKIVRLNVDLAYGLMAHHANEVAYALGFSKAEAKPFSKMLQKLYTVFRAMDAELVEINPLFLTKEGEFVAGDGKLMIDDNAMFRHEKYAQAETDYKSEAEYDAHKEGIPFIQFDGDISLMCAGAGLTTTVYDLINYEGGSVANYLEFGGPNYKKAVKAMEICLKVPSKVILVVTFGTIARADVMAEGIVDAIHRLKPDRPVVTCIRGTNEEQAVEILKDAGLEPIFDTEEAVRKAVELAKEGSK